jgi:hypothetical protein
MDRVPPYSAQKLEAACRVLGDTERGLTGPEIGYLLQDCGVEDVDTGNTKWKRLFNALAGAQNKHGVGNHLVMFINRALDPVKYSRQVRLAAK